MDSEVTSFLQQQSTEVDTLERATCLASWNANVTGEEKFYEEEIVLGKKLNEMFSSPVNFQRVNHLLQQDLTPLERRQLEVLRLAYLSAQTDVELLNQETELSSSIEKEFNLFRAVVNGKEVTDNEIKELLAESTDSRAVEEAWKASKTQGEKAAPKVIEIAKLRNQIARNLGFNNYCDFSLAVSEQTEPEVTRVLGELEELTREPFRQVKDKVDTRISAKFGIPKQEIRPWHYGDLFFQESPKFGKVDLDSVYKTQDVIAIAKQFYADIGLDVSDILARSDLFEKKGKNQHAFCTTIGRDGDVRILENVVNNEHWMETTLHELGHAVYEKYLDKGLPFLLKQSAHTFVTEAVAMIFGRLSKDPKFIKRYTGLDLPDDERATLKELERERQLVFARWVMTVYNFEKELYSNPDQDLNKKWWELVSKYQMIDFQRDKPDWASKIHVACYPMYYHNYLLGEVLASQIGASLKANLSEEKLLHPHAGKFLTERIFAPGSRLRWDNLIETSLEERLNPKYFAQDFV